MTKINIAFTDAESRDAFVAQFPAAKVVRRKDGLPTLFVRICAEARIHVVDPTAPGGVNLLGAFFAPEEALGLPFLLSLFPFNRKSDTDGKAADEKLN